MNRVTLVLPLAFILSFCFVGDAAPCGDKFLVGNISLTQREIGAIVPVSILAYSADITMSLQGSDIAGALVAAGHALSFASGPDALTESLRAGRYEIVLMGYQDAHEARDIVLVNAPDSIILPVVGRADRPHLSAAKSEFGVVLSVPTHLPRLLAMIDKALLLQQ